MSRPERAAGLIAAARQRHEQARREALNALRRLEATDAPVNFSTVASAAGVSRAWLYRQTDLRSRIERLRSDQPRADGNRTASAHRVTLDSLRQQLDSLRIRHAELQDENRQLREALARRLGQRRMGLPWTSDTAEPNVEDMSTT